MCAWRFPFRKSSLFWKASPAKCVSFAEHNEANAHAYRLAWAGDKSQVFSIRGGAFHIDLPFLLIDLLQSIAEL